MMHIDTSELRREAVVCDPAALCRALGIDRVKKRQAKGLLVCCPAHADRDPSCSVTRRSDGTLGVKCFSCGFSADAIGLVQQVRGTDFRGAVDELVRLSGRWDLLDRRPPNQPYRPVRPKNVPSKPPPEPVQPLYPLQADVDAVWSISMPVAEDSEAAAMLTARGLNAKRIDDLGLARVIPKGVSLPSWACCGGRSWAGSGHRLIFPVYDAQGVRRSFRSWRVVQGSSPKRLAPFGYSVSGLVLADPFAVAVLRERAWIDGLTLEAVVCEGESDFLTWATRFSDADENVPVVLGVVSGAWAEDVASRIPDGARVVVRTDLDQAGERYAEDIIRTLAPRCEVYRPRRSSTEAA